MRRAVTLLLSAAALGAALVTGMATAAPARTQTGAKVQLRSTSVGTILVNGRGFTLYMFAKDTRNHNACVAIKGCSAIWPALLTSGKPVAASGVKASLLGTIKLSGGKQQVTYAGRPLYTYVADTRPGSTSYVGVRQFGGAWYAMSAAGKIVK